MAEARVYATVARLAFRRQSTYRGAMFASLFTNVVFGFVLAGLMRAVVAQRGNVNGWDAADLVTATFATQALLSAIAAFGERELSERVATGQIAGDLIRPVSLEGWTVSTFLGRSTAQFSVRALPTFAAGALVFHMHLPRPAIAAAALVAVVLAAVLASLWWLIVNLTAFWLVSAKGTIQLATTVGYVLSGIAFPLVLLPEGVERMVRHLPWAAQVQLPVEVFVSKRSTISVLMATYGLQIIWILVFVVIAHLMVRAGRHKLVVQGG